MQNWDQTLFGKHYEVFKEDSEMMTLLEWTDIIKGLADIKVTYLDGILKIMQGLQAGKGPFENDFSLLQIKINRG